MFLDPYLVMIDKKSIFGNDFNEKTIHIANKEQCFTWKWISLNDSPRNLVLSFLQPVWDSGGAIFQANYTEIKAYTPDELFKMVEQGKEIPLPKTQVKVIYFPSIDTQSLIGLVDHFDFAENRHRGWSEEEIKERKEDAKDILTHISTITDFRFIELSVLGADVAFPKNLPAEAFEELFTKFMDYNEKFYSIEGPRENLLPGFRRENRLKLGWV